jgi:hypothetical protein
MATPIAPTPTPPALDVALPAQGGGGFLFPPLLPTAMPTAIATVTPTPPPATPVAPAPTTGAAGAVGGSERLSQAAVSLGADVLSVEEGRRVEIVVALETDGPVVGLIVVLALPIEAFDVVVAEVAPALGGAGFDGRVRIDFETGEAILNGGFPDPAAGISGVILRVVMTLKPGAAPGVHRAELRDVVLRDLAILGAGYAD